MIILRFVLVASLGCTVAQQHFVVDVAQQNFVSRDLSIGTQHGEQQQVDDETREIVPPIPIQRIVPQFQTQPNWSILTSDEWMRLSCTNNSTRGCKQLSGRMLELVKLRESMAYEMVARNQVPDPLYHFPSNLTTPETLRRRNTNEYLGVMLDAGAHYFDMEWIRNLLHSMHALQYNLLHLRLTSDHIFAFDAMPGMAHSPTGQVYSVHDLQQLQEMAKSLNIVVVPEINLPMHAGSWAGPHTPSSIIVPCTDFVCNNGMGLPLNVTHPQLPHLVQTVMKQVVTIFDTAPWYHLGGDALFAATRCFREARIGPPAEAMTAFEQKLKQIMQDLGVSDDRIARYEMTGRLTGLYDTLSAFQLTGGLTHYYRSHDYQWDKQDESNGQEFDAPKASNGMLFTTGLSLDVLPDTSGAYQVYDAARRAPEKARALIVGTFGFGPEQWMDRNVLGRMLGVAMGVSNIEPQNFVQEYIRICKFDLSLDPRICNKFGTPLLSDFTMSYETQMLNTRWREYLCQRLTERNIRRDMIQRSWYKRHSSTVAMTNFWNHFATEPPQFASSVLSPPKNSSRRLEGITQLDSRVTHAGISVDFTLTSRDGRTLSSIFQTLDIMNLLGLNTLQVRILSDVGFSINIPMHSQLSWGSIMAEPFSESTIQDIVKYAKKLGIQVIPEITTVTRGGGWFEAGILVECPKVMCTAGKGIAANSSDSDFVGIIISILHELMELFQNPPYIHLGFDEREEAKVCYEEAGASVDLDNFERILSKALKFQDFDESRLIRWENTEGVVYPMRAGQVTHYHLKEPAVSRDSPFFVSTGLNFADPEGAEMDAWAIYKTTRRLLKLKPTGIIGIVDMIHGTFWRDFSIPQRLVAFAMGLSSSPDFETKSEFEARRDELMVNFDKQNGVSAQQLPKGLLSRRSFVGDGTIRNATLARHRAFVHWGTRVNETCELRSVSITENIAREGVLVSRKIPDSSGLDSQGTEHLKS